MEVDVSMANEPEASVSEDEDATDDSAMENEICGICADVVIDRGVLDCCDHWFCFACIDNWATITNLCPFCKLEFQLITCLPVFATIGSIGAEEHAISRDDDWCIQEKNNTLSFPSYYIDEDAVLCLGGDGCKIRSGLPITEEDLTYDTSIACDSCDIWYHAFCVGFNPDISTSENSWLCPRCITDDTRQKSNEAPIENWLDRSAPGSDIRCTMHSSLSGKVSVSVADDGETAVVVSMVGGLENVEPVEVSLSVAGLVKSDDENGTPTLDADGASTDIDLQLDKSVCTELKCDSLISSHVKSSIANSEILMGTSKIDLKEKLLEIPSIVDTASELTVAQTNNNRVQTPITTAAAVIEEKEASFPSSILVTDSGLKADNADEMLCEPLSSDGFESLSASMAYDSSKTNGQISGSYTDIKISPGLAISTPSDMSVVTSSEDIIDVLPENITLSDLMGKPKEEPNTHIEGAACLENHSRIRDAETVYPSKKAKSDGKPRKLSSRSQANVSFSDKSKGSSMTVADTGDDSSRFTRPEKARHPDIMSIVQEVGRQSHNGPTGTKAADKLLERKENVVGLRVKKIMRRAGTKEESSILVQKLRKEIRESVSDKMATINANSNDFDIKLLTAFRAAIVKPKDELVNKSAPACRSLRKSLLQKGKTRESLTKKIYATSSGKRKRGWDREWEVEFWKHRCKVTKPEKAESLNSVLELLKKATNSCSNDSGTDQEPEVETSSILSRVYLADTSVFPRKDVVKPLSTLAECSRTPNERNMAPSGTSRSSTEVKIVSSDGTGKNPGSSGFTEEISRRKGIIDGMMTKSVAKSESRGSNGTIHSKEIASQSDSGKSDKRKWALEVLARKNALVNSSGSKGTEEDNSTLKGNYPLLAQLPADMRPVPAPSRHNKVPISVRQAQLYRITEHYLRRTSLPVMRKTADTELAVADAVNVEHGIFERSNSKLVYINLCSQALSHRPDKPVSAEKVTSTSTTAIADVTDQMPKGADSDPSVGRWSNVEEALKLAGLSDSPPESPCRPTTNNPNVEDDPNFGVVNVLDMDSQPEMDIYGDFEYDLGDEGYLEASKLQQKESGDSKIKVVLSTVNCDEPVQLQDPKPQSSDTELLAKDQSKFKAKIGGLKDNKPLITKPSEDEMSKELSLTEYELLYGRDEELFANKMPSEVTREMSKPMEMEAVDKNVIPCDSETNHLKDEGRSNDFEKEGCAENSFDGGRAQNHVSGGETSPAHSLMSKNVWKEKAAKPTCNESRERSNSIYKKVEAYVKEHIRPLYKCRVITAEQYRWAAQKTTEKVMKYHYKAKNANFLIKEGEKVKKLAGQYVETAQKQEL